MEPYSLRPATLADVSGIVGMRNDLNTLELAACPHASIQKLSVPDFTELWGATFDDAGYCWRVLEREGQLIGFGLIYLTRSRPVGGFLHWAYVAAGHRRHGLGQRLVGDLLAWAKAKGARHIELQYIEGNDLAAGFWTKLGFRSFARKCVLYPK